MLDIERTFRSIGGHDFPVSIGTTLRLSHGKYRDCNAVVPVALIGMEELWPAVLLAWVAGFVDALGYLALSHVFTAHMSGNSAALGAHLGRQDWHEAMIRGLAIPPFIIGVALGVLAETVAAPHRRRARLVPAFGLELVCLVVFLCVDSHGPAGPVRSGTPLFFALITLLALAMGLQSATLRRAGGTRVRTTYISGMLTNMTENGVLWLVRQTQRAMGRAVDRAIADQPLGSLALKFGLIFVSFIIGGACGGFGETKWGSIALVAPIAGLALLILQDCCTPAFAVHSS